MAKLLDEGRLCFLTMQLGPYQHMCVCVCVCV